MRLFKRHRLAKGMTFEQMAGRLKVGVATVHAWESGRNLPRPDMIPKIARLLELDPLELTRVIAPEPVGAR